MLALCLVPELACLASDYGLWVPRFRRLAIDYGGFWIGLLGDWRSNYPLQPVAMFFTYGFIHAGLMHFLVNMLTLVALAPGIARRFGNVGFAALYALSLAGGAAGFALLADTSAPMVGASGALFGLAGALLAADYAELGLRHRSRWPVIRAVLSLAALNLLLWWAMHGQLAWETHLGGFIVGWVWTLVRLRRGTA